MKQTISILIAAIAAIIALLLLVVLTIDLYRAIGDMTAYSKDWAMLGVLWLVTLISTGLCMFMPAALYLKIRELI
jgi:hypothetical protein